MSDNNNEPVNGLSNETSQYQFWHKELTASQKDLQPWHDQAARIVKRYNDERDSKSTRKLFNLFATNTDILQAALFARIPRPDVERRFRDADDQVGRVAALILQRALTYELETDDYFGTTAKNSIQDYLIAGLGCAWVRYDVDKTEEQAQVIEPGNDIFEGLFVSDDAEEQAEVSTTVTVITDERTPIDYVHWEDFFYTPARTWEEVRWVARRSYMNRAALEKRFGEEVADAIAFEVNKEQAHLSNQERKSSIPQGEVFEIWDKNSKKVYWFSFHYKGILDEKDDDCHLPGFFPTKKPLFANSETSRLLPHPDYTKVKDQYEELDTINARISTLMRTLSVKGVFNGNSKAVAELVNATENKLVGVGDMQQFAEKGGARGNIEFFPMQEIQTVIAGLNDARDRIKAQIYELTGISDIVRGVGQMYATATAEQLKSQYASLRLTIKQQAVAEYISGLIQLKAHLMCKWYTADRLLARAGQLSPNDQPYVADAIQLLKETDLTHFRLEVSVDALQAPDWNADKQQRGEVIMAISQLLGQALPAVEKTPELAPLVGDLMNFSVAGFKGSQTIEGGTQDFVKKFKATLDKKAQEPKQPPPPTDAQVRADVEKMKIQANDAQLKAQAQIDQQEAKAQREFDIQKSLHDFEIKKMQIELEAKIQAQNMVIQQRQLAIEEQKVQMDKLKILVSARDASRQINVETGFAMPGISFDGLDPSMGGDSGLGQVVDQQYAQLGADVNNTELVTKEDMVASHESLRAELTQAFTDALHNIASMPAPEQVISIERDAEGKPVVRIH